MLVVSHHITHVLLYGGVRWDIHPREHFIVIAQCVSENILHYTNRTAYVCACIFSIMLLSEITLGLLHNSLSTFISIFLYMPTILIEYVRYSSFFFAN